MKRKNALAVLLFVLTLALTSFASVPDQPFMQAARTDLQKAKAALQRAEHNKGGHRANAISLINSAIQEVNRGMNYDRNNVRRRYESDLNDSDNFVTIQPAAADQPNMRDALRHLENAKQNLLSATADKGGHRQKRHRSY